MATPTPSSQLPGSQPPGQKVYSEENPPEENDYTPAAVKFREEQTKKQEMEKAKDSREAGATTKAQPVALDTNHEQHGGTNPISQEVDENKDPAPRHYDGEAE